MDWQKLLTQAGYRISKPRKQVMQLLESTQTPHTALAIYEQLKAQGARSSLVSVYRTLELFAALGLISLVFEPGGSLGYVPASAGHHHFIVCQVCHRAVEFNGTEDLAGFVNQVEGQTDFSVSDHLLQFFGICPNCQINPKETSS
jgi:Fe2+ or Zn2+ uptake regulation protein